MQSKLATVLGTVMFLCVTVSWGAEASFNEQTLSKAVDQYGYKARHRLLDWQALITSFRDVPVQKKLYNVNGFINSLRYVGDLRHWRQEEYWATPFQTVASGGGDCEDMAIAKYFTLKAIGVSAENLYITYVKLPRRRESHMVLVYRPEHGEAVVLDNLIDAIKPLSRRHDLLPVYSFNDAGLWLADKTGRPRRVGAVTRIRYWRDLSARLKSEPLGL